MCLYTKETKLKTAQKDIICYKVLLKHPSSTIFYTPYLYQRILWTDILLHNPIKAKGCVRKRKQFNTAQPSFNIGLIHTYQYPINLAGCGFYGTMYQLYQCVIPKGTLYIDGLNDQNKPTYASKLIIFQQQVKQ